MNWTPAIPYIVAAAAAVASVGGGKVATSEANTFWRETVGLIAGELDQAQAERDRCLEHVYEVN